MSDQPTHTQDPQEGDSLDQAMDKSPARSAPGQRSPADNRCGKRSSVYLYLVVLFGAAFLMLLLAYFVQQRNNESAISDLRNTMNLSREQLVEEIGTLTKENESLQQENEDLQAQLAELQQQKDELEEQSFWREKELMIQSFSWSSLWLLEQNFRDQDYDACVQFFQNATTSNYYYTPDEAADRVEEIYWVLVDEDVLNEEDFPLSVILGKPSADEN